MLSIKNKYNVESYIDDLKIEEIKLLDSFDIVVKFNTGEVKVLELKYCLSESYFTKLNDFEIFNKCEISNGKLSWLNGEIEISPVYIYLKGSELEYYVSIVDLKVLDGYNIYFKFNDGEERIYDFEPLLDEGVFQQLKDMNVFRSVKLQYGVPTWLDWTVDLAADCIYENGKRCNN